MRNINSILDAAMIIPYRKAAVLRHYVMNNADLYRVERLAAKAVNMAASDQIWRFVRAVDWTKL